MKQKIYKLKLCYLLPVAILLLSNMLYSQSSFREIATINIKSLNLKKSIKFNTTEFRLASKKVMGKYYTFNFRDIIDPYLKNLSTTQRKNVFIIAETGGGSSMAISYSETDPDIVPIAPLMIYGKVTGSVGDTVIIKDIEGVLMSPELEAVQGEFQIVAKQRLYLQMKKMSKKQRKRIFRKGTIIFPVDKSDRRWMTGVIKFKVCIFDPAKKE